MNFVKHFQEKTVRFQNIWGQPPPPPPSPGAYGHGLFFFNFPIFSLLSFPFFFVFSSFSFFSFLFRFFLYSLSFLSFLFFLSPFPSFPFPFLSFLPPSPFFFFPCSPSGGHSAPLPPPPSGTPVMYLTTLNLSQDRMHQNCNLLYLCLCYY